MGPQIIKPPRLRKGDTIGVVAPAGAVHAQDLDKGLKRLQDLGFRIRIGEAVHRTFRGMAGTDAQRAQDLMDMFRDPGVHAIVCARGGYGSSRIISLLDSEIIRNHPKIFVGSSDITILLLYLIQVCGLVAFHGPMIIPHFGKVQSPVTEAFFIKALVQGNALDCLDAPDVRILKPGRAEGELIGGCLSLLCSAVGTPYAVRTQDRVLFIEDVNEPAYRIDRMLTQWKNAGLLSGVRGIVFGRMPGCLPDPDGGYSLEDLIRDVLEDFHGPVLFGMPSGHGPDCLTMPMGIKVSVTAPARSGDLAVGARVSFMEEGLVGQLP